MELSALVREAQAASPADRIVWRDRIAAYGRRAIEAVRPWLTDPALAAFAIRVIERAGAEADRSEAIRVLRSSRSKVPPLVKGDVDWALRRLQPRSARSAGRQQPPVTPQPVRQERPHLATVPRRHAR
jgi:hypothetical protein